MKNTQTFTVDASLLQELGERLIGRPTIALAELVKNSYDADSSVCRIEFREDQIVISDDGFGMSERDFLDHWMRIGTTHKVDKRTSPGGRSFSGSKGIGRLSVQFLADEMTLESTDAAGKSVFAYVDWRNVVRGENLDTVNVLWDLDTTAPTYADGCSTGMRITLSKLKTTWDEDALKNLGRELFRLRSPFRRPAAKSRVRRAEEFEIEVDAPGIAAAQEAFDSVLRIVLDSWKARIRGSLERGRIGTSANLTVEFAEDYPANSEKPARYREMVDIPVRPDSADEGPYVDRARFEILIYRPEGRQAGGIPVAELRRYLVEFGNVSLYDSSFRLPYYGSGREASGHDWLSMALDQGRRINVSELLPERLHTNNKYMQDLPAPGRIFGVVDIDTNHERIVASKTGAPPGHWLQIQPGRDRLHDNAAFQQLRDLVRYSLDFYANRHRLRALQVAEKKRATESPSKKYDRAIEVLERNRDELPSPVLREIRREVVAARRASIVEEETLDRRAALLAPLATAGMAALALSHELARETRFLERIGAKLKRIARLHALPDLASIASEFDGARRRLGALQDVFAPLLSDIDMEGTDRLKVQPVVEQSVSAMRVLMPRVEFDLSDIPRDLRFPIGSLAEWNALLQNILSNSWNAMLDSAKARIAFKGGRDGRGKEWLRSSDTGKGLGIPLADAARLFEPFERRLKISDDKRSIAIGGQGLGLAIVRMIARRRSAMVQFVDAETPFSTTLEVSWKAGRK